MSPTKRSQRGAVSLLLMVAFGLTTRSSFADHYMVPTGSMEPTVQVGDRILVAKAAYGLRLPLTHIRLASFGAPSRGDVVVLESPENGIVLLKRVVAIGGDRVAVNDGMVTIDGKAQPMMEDPAGRLAEDLGGKEHSIGSLGGTELPETRIPDGYVLVMGDNRGNSHDGRDFGLVPEDRVLGRAVGVFLRHGGFAWQKL